MSRLESEPFREPKWSSRRERPQESAAKRISRCMNYTPCRGRLPSTVAQSLNPCSKVNGCGPMPRGHPNELLFGNENSGVQNRVSIPKLCGNCFMAQVPESTKSFTQPVWAEKRSHKTSRPSSKPWGSRSAQVFRRACFKQSLHARAVFHCCSCPIHSGCAY